jgi:metal-responsive CopG/Arc/MetJ family transcriptional regulator
VFGGKVRNKTTKAKEEQGTTGISVRLPNEMLAQIDKLANEERRTRGNAIRLLLEEALQQRRGV